MKYLLIICFLFISLCSNAQDNDSVAVKKIYNEVLKNGKGYSWLNYLCNKIGGRISGSPQAQSAVDWSEKILSTFCADSVWLQPIMVPVWIRGEKEQCSMTDSKGSKLPLNICALGFSTGTPQEGITADIIEVKDFDQLAMLGRKNIEGKIVFFNHPFEPTDVHPFNSYGQSVAYRWRGPSEAARYGAVASLVRSMTHSEDDFPHTGSMRYNDSLPKIPCAALGFLSANALEEKLKSGKVTVTLKMNCTTKEDAPSFNVVGEIKGSEHPEEIIVIGGHLDSWDNGQGAHDDGAGIAHCMEALRSIKAIGIKPKRTIRMVCFMNEENGLRGGKKYAELAKSNNEKTIFALESDEGGFAPEGFGLDMDEKKRNKIKSWSNIFAPYDIWKWSDNGGGADIGPLEELGVPVSNINVSPQRYFDYHHTANDTFDKVNKRELHLGAAAIAALAWLISEHGLE